MNSTLNVKDYLWLTISNLLIIVASVFRSSLILIIISLMGINYTYLVAKGKRFAYAFGFINSVLYAIYLLLNNIYAMGIYNLIYAVPMCVYGYYYWSKKENLTKVNNLNLHFKIFLFIFIIVAIYILHDILSISGGNIPFFDSLSTVLCALGTLLTSMKYKEQWIVWIIANFVNVIIWLGFSIESISNISILAMWIVYFVNSLYGAYNWNKH